MVDLVIEQILSLYGDGKLPLAQKEIDEARMLAVAGFLPTGVEISDVLGFCNVMQGQIKLKESDDVCFRVGR